MTDEKKSYRETAKQIGWIISLFGGGVAFGRYVMPAIQKKLSNAKVSGIDDAVLLGISEARKHLKDKPEYSLLKDPLDALENYFSDRKYREQNK